MRILYTFFLLSIIPTLNAQTTHTVEVGGGSGVTPYYEPQFITIEVGDDVLWDCISGFHNVSSTSGPEAFSHPSESAPWQFTHTFTIAGEYDYECTVGNHAATQFGSITVVEPVSVSVQTGIEGVTFYPNPVSDQLYVSNVPEGVAVRLFDLTGKIVMESVADGSELVFDVSAQKRGMYFLEIKGDEHLTRDRVILK